ncbi:outer membrane fimbrial usher protein [Salmonella enterica subsp. enterica serovar Braenderup]|nr:outer membrane fimbrial usher protein [Salmonella enterica subsp. enterica serovar Braenderup]
MANKNKFIPTPLSFLSLCIILTLSSPSLAEEVDFDPSFLRKSEGHSVIDVNRFKNGNPIPPGNYNSEIYLNGEWKGTSNIEYRDVNGAASLCVTPELLALLDLSSEAIKSEASDKKCTIFKDTVKDAKSKFDISRLRLDIDIPQALVNVRPRGYISPTQWQSGVTAAFVNYDTNFYKYHSNNVDSEQSYLGIKSGINIGGWAFRHRGSNSWSDGKSQGYKGIETNVQRDIAFLRAQLTVGDFSTNSELMESASLRGLGIASDDRMLPRSQRGYAPVVRGIANSNSKVTIRQNGSLIYETTVPAGPFTISDLYPSGYGGDLVVTITESNGQSRTFSVPFSSVAQLLRPGQSRWQAAVGRYRYGNQTSDENVFLGTYQYGLTNDVTLNSGLITAEHYNSALGGVAFNTPIGAIASDITLSKTHFTNSDVTRNGYSLHSSYSVNFQDTKTNLTLAAYRYSSKDYYTLRDAMSANNSKFIDDISIKNAANYRPKNQFQLSINQDLGDNKGNLYLTGSTFNYWGRDGQYNEYQLGYSNYWKRVNYQLGFSQSRSNDSYRRDDRIYLNFSIPLGESIKSPLLSSTVNYSNKGKSNIQTSLSGVAGMDNQFSYGAAFNARKGEEGYSINGGYRSPFVNLSATAGNDSNSNRQVSLGASGAIVAHPYGLTLSNDLSDTFAIIHAKGASNAVIRNYPGARIDYFGNGIVPYVTPYEKNQISIEPSNLPLDVELSSTEQEIIPRANSATLIKINTENGKSSFFDLTMSDGSKPPMASEILDDTGKSVGYVAQGGRAFVRGVGERGNLTVSWGMQDNERCSFHYNVDKKSNNKDNFSSIKKYVCNKRGN